MWATSGGGGVVVETACSTSFVLYFNPSLRHWWVASILLAHCGAIFDILARQLGLKGPRLASIDLNAIFHILTDCPPITIPANKPSAQNQSPPYFGPQPQPQASKSRVVPTICSAVLCILNTAHLYMVQVNCRPCVC